MTETEQETTMPETPHLTKVGGDDPLDFLGIDALLDDEERQISATVRQLVRDRVLPYVSEWYESGTFPSR